MATRSTRTSVAAVSTSETAATCCCTCAGKAESPPTHAEAAPAASGPQHNDNRQMPALAALIASALEANPLLCTASTSSAAPPQTKLAQIAPAIASPVSSPRAADPLSATFDAARLLETSAPTISPSSVENRRKRRKREAITLPANVSASGKDLRRLKNRIAVSRLRERAVEGVRRLEEEVQRYKERCEFLEALVSCCSTCASLSTVRVGEIELLPACEVHVKKEQNELDGGELPMLTEEEIIVLSNALNC
ncbi:unnamed protein product [Phytophthora fragariaefolia]|uniref:Unnamed protein product n=1 Tax=Phytophthora fragariaefolia TaxID=1490495 RepID=A0A9W6X3J3_9STRA|nr:unnamed protein product [Phytophthora fragariaefolia]